MRHISGYFVIICIVTASMIILPGCNDGGSALPPPGVGALGIDASATKTVGYGYLSTSFYVNVTGGNPPYMAVWDFGDGSDPQVGLRVSHLYEGPGNYTCSVLVYDTLDTDAGVGGSVAHDFVECFVFASGI